jgi:hypothetical protein
MTGRHTAGLYCIPGHTREAKIATRRAPSRSTRKTHSKMHLGGQLYQDSFIEQTPAKKYLCPCLRKAIYSMYHTMLHRVGGEYAFNQTLQTLPSPINIALILKAPCSFA